MTDTESHAAEPAVARAEPLLAVTDLRTYFHTEAGVVKAVDGISFELAPGEVLAVVGESGSGKSVTGLSILGLLPQPVAKIESGDIVWKGKSLLRASKQRMRSLRGAEIAMIFQDPMTSLNPVYRVGEQVAEAIRVHDGLRRRKARARVIELFEAVGIPQPAKRYDMYPHEFSGGMRQRVVVAMAIACDPDLIIADEPTTALDVTVQAQVLELLAEVQDRTGAAMMLITHDLGVVAGVADRVMVMYAGRQVETGSVDDIFYDSHHPYTLGLMGSLPRVDAGADRAPLRPIGGQPPSLLNPPSGCAFHPRCAAAHLPTPCASDEPVLLGVGGPGHQSACHLANSLPASLLAARRVDDGGAS